DAEPNQLQAATSATVTLKTNLAEATTPLIGRDEEVDLIQAQLGAQRLVSIVGPGGVGKSRVACGVAGRLRTAFGDGPWLIELSSLADPAALPTNAAQVLGIALRGLRSPLDDLVAALAQRETLIVLDNCEHVLAQATAFAHAVLTRAPGVRLLVTSQQPMKLP